MPLFVEKGMKIYRIAQEDYKGVHTAPQPGIGSGSPMHDLTDIYPDDLYSPEGVRYYGTGDSWDYFTFSIVRAARNKPNYRVKIYRAVPDVNAEIDKERKQINDILSYSNSYGFLPMNNQIVAKIEEEQGLHCVVDKREILEILYQRAEELWSKRRKIKINQGDWVTINPEYAKFHGRSWLNNKFKVITKTVRAKDLYTNGDSIHEWGYWPQ